MVTRKKFLNFAFTLVEILIVSSIIGAITIFTASNGPTQLKKVRDSVRKSDIDLIKKAIEEYYQDVECYPQTIPTCKNSLMSGDLKVLANIPCDPKTKLSYTYVPETSSCPKWYQLYANLEYESDHIIQKIGCSNGCGPECKFNYGASSPNQKLTQFCQTVQNSQNNTPSNSPTPMPKIDQYVCSQNGNCEIFANPDKSGCPNIYVNDPTCQGACSKTANRCHDARGKKNQ